MMKFSTLNNYYSKYFSKDIYYIYSMTIYHVLIIIFTFLGISHDSNVFYTLTLSGGHENIFQTLSSFRGAIESYILILIIFLLDALFLIVLMLEFKWMRLNFKKLFLIEITLIGISFFIPFFRDVMFFLSLNSVQIYIVYRILMKNIWFFKFPFIFSSYIYILRLIIEVII